MKNDADDQGFIKFVGLVQKQEGTVTIGHEGITFRATGSVNSATFVSAQLITKFQVSPATSQKAILRFEKKGNRLAISLPAKSSCNVSSLAGCTTAEAPFQIQVILTEDVRCGLSDSEHTIQARIILEQVCIAPQIY
jgi:hypothetical protein